MSHAYEVQLFSDMDDEAPRYSLTFTEMSKAVKFKNEIENDDSLQGVNRVDLIMTPLDDTAIDEFWYVIATEEGGGE